MTKKLPEITMAEWQSALAELIESPPPKGALKLSELAEKMNLSEGRVRLKIRRHLGKTWDSKKFGRWVYYWPKKK